MKKDEKTKKIIFSEEIDSAINGYAIGFSFIGIGVFLFLKPDYFFAPLASYIVGAIIGAIGVAGTGVELSRSSKIKGMDNLILGLIILAFWLVLYLKVHAFWCNLISFVLLIIGCYAVCLGIIQGIYSIINNIQKNKVRQDGAKLSFGTIIGQSVLFLTQLCGLVIAILNVAKAVGAL